MTQDLPYKLYKLSHRSRRSTELYEKGRYLGLKLYHMQHGKSSYSQSLSLANSITLKGLDRCDYVLGFLLASCPQSVNMLTLQDLERVVGYDKYLLNLYLS